MTKTVYNIKKPDVYNVIIGILLEKMEYVKRFKINVKNIIIKMENVTVVIQGIF